MAMMFWEITRDSEVCTIKTKTSMWSLETTKCQQSQWTPWLAMNLSTSHNSSTILLSVDHSSNSARSQGLIVWHLPPLVIRCARILILRVIGRAPIKRLLRLLKREREIHPQDQLGPLIDKLTLLGEVSTRPSSKRLSVPTAISQGTNWTQRAINWLIGRMT